VHSLDTIRPFLRPIAHLLDHAAITEVMVNGSGRIFIERDGELERVPDVTVTEQNLRVAVRNLARVLGDDISEEQPLLDARLTDGSRVAAVLPPVSLGGTTLTIRKFQQRRFTPEELLERGMDIDRVG
jgi:pilus assembly protein CpaF